MQGWIEPFDCCILFVVSVLCYCIYLWLCYRGDVMIEKYTMSDCSRSVFLLSGSVTITARIFQIVSPYSPKLYLVHLVRPFRKSVSTLYSDVGGLYVIVCRWCWSITLSISLFSHIFHSSECITLVWCPSGFEKLGGFPLPTRANSMGDRRKWG